MSVIMQNKEKYISKLVYNLRFFALLSIVISHTNFTFVPPYPLLILFINLSVFGVSFFFFINGFYYSRKENFYLFFMNKIKRILIPWIIIGSSVYLIMAFGNHLSFNFKIYLDYVYLAKSYLWYLPVMLIIEILVYFIPKKYEKSILLVSGIVYALAYIYKQNLDVLQLNIVNGLLFFSLGLFFKTNRNFIRFNNVFVLLLSIFIYSQFVFRANFSIVSINALIETLCLIYVFGFISDFLIIKNINVLEKFGKNSLSIYLLHMPIVGKMNVLFKYVPYLIPFLTIFGIYYLLVIILKYIKNKSFRNFVFLITGFKLERGSYEANKG